MQAVLAPQSKAERKKIKASPDLKMRSLLTIDDLIRSDDAFFAATGITDGPFLEGIHYDRRGGLTTHSIVIRALSGSMRYIKGVHQLRREIALGGRVGVEEAVEIATQ